MSDKNFMAYGDAESVLTGYANGINANKKNLSNVSYEYYIRNGLKNLAVINQESSTMNTITFTNNGDGTWTVNGTNSKSSSAYCFPMIVGPGYFKPGRYTLTGIPSGAENISLTLRYNGGSGNTSIATVNGSTPSVTFDLTAAQVAAATLNFNLMIGVPANATVNNITVSPMLVYEEVGLINNSFEQYHKTNKELEEDKVSWEDYSKTGVKNLIPYPYLNSTRTVNGVTFTDNGNGTITVNGTATDDVGFNMFARATTNNLLSTIGTGRYILTGCPQGGSTSTYCIDFGYGNAESYIANIARDMGDGANAVITSDMLSYNGQITIVVKQGVTLTNAVFRPMLRLASDPDNTYQPYAMTNAELTQSVNDLKFSISQSVTLSTSAATTVTFTNAKITANSIVDLGFSEWGIFPDDVVCTSGVCTVTLPQVESAKTITVTLFLK